MRLHYLLGNRSAALSVYRRLHHLMQHELAAAPDPQTQALAGLIEAAGRDVVDAGRPPAGSAPVPTTDMRSTPVPPSSHAAAAWAALARPPHLLQRERAWAALSSAWLERGRVIIQAVAGMGKSRLLEDFCHSIGPHTGRPPLQLALRAGDAGVPFALLSRWLDAAWQQSAAALRGLPDWARAELARLLPVLGAAAAGAPVELRLLQAFKELARWHDAVFIDDLQHADNASLELLPAVLDDMRTVVLCVRTGELPAAVMRWAEQGDSDPRESVHRLTLEPWQAPTIAALLRSAGWSAAPAARWSVLLQRHAGGHPLAVLETLRAVLRTQLGAAELPEPPAELPVPQRLLTLLLRRIQSLSPLARQIADVAALAGPAFTPELAATALQCTSHALAEPWRELLAASLIDPAGQWHDIVLEAARSDLAAPWARELHRRIAAAGEERGVAPARLARHWAEGGQPARAAACHEAAAADAARLSRIAEQAEHHCLAAEQWLAADDPTRAFDARAHQAEASVRGAQLDAGLGLARDLLVQADPKLPRQRAQALRVLALGSAMQLTHRHTRDTARMASAAARDAGEPAWRSEAALLWALSAAHLGDSDDAEAALAEVAAVALPLQAWRERLNWAATMAHVYTLLGRPEAALAYQHEALAMSQRPEAATERMALLNNLAAMLLRTGRRDTEALTHAEQSLVLAQRLGLEDSTAGFGARLHVALSLQSLGMLGRAVEAFEHSLDVAVRMKLGGALVTVQNHLAGLWIQLGQPERAARLLEEGSGLSHSARVRRWTLWYELHVLCGRPPPPDPAPDASVDTDPVVAAHLQLVLLRRLAAAARPAALPALLQHFDRLQLPAWSRKARVLALTAMVEQRADDEARHLALALHDELVRDEPCAGYRLEAFWLVGTALRALGDACRADALLARARQGLERALEQVPPALRSGLCQGNRINRDLLVATGAVPLRSH